jgi:hypothetical protein
MPSDAVIEARCIVKIDRMVTLIERYPPTLEQPRHVTTCADLSARISSAVAEFQASVATLCRESAGDVLRRRRLEQARAPRTTCHHTRSW